MSDVTTFCSLWKIDIPSRETLCLTDHDEVIIHEAHTYLPQNSADPAQANLNAGLSVDSGGVRTSLSGSDISPQDIRDGALDNALFFHFQHDWRSGETKLLFKGRVGEVSFTGREMLIEWLGQASLLDQTTGRVFSRQCDASFGDSRCGLNIADFAEGTTCPRTHTACRDTFGNTDNFRGFPYLLGDDALQAGVADSDPRDGSSRYS